MKKLILIVSAFAMIGCTYSPTDVRTNNYSTYPSVRNYPVVLGSSPFVRVIPRQRVYPDYPPYRDDTPPVYFAY